MDMQSFLKKGGNREKSDYHILHSNEGGGKSNLHDEWNMFPFLDVIFLSRQVVLCSISFDFRSISCKNYIIRIHFQ